MLLQSQLGYVQFLPALPKQWETGYVRGIVARGNFVIDMEWTNGTADSFTIASRNGGTFTGEYKNLAAYKVTDSLGRPVSVEICGNDRISFASEPGAIYHIQKAGQ